MNLIFRTSGSVVGPAVATVILSAYSITMVDPVTHVVVSVPEDYAYQLVFLLSIILAIIGAIIAIFISDKRALGEGKGFEVRKFGNSNAEKSPRAGR